MTTTKTTTNTKPAIDTPADRSTASESKAWFQQALSAVRQGQSLNDFILHAHPLNRAVARIAYIAASKHNERDALIAVSEAAKAICNDNSFWWQEVGELKAKALKDSIANLAAVRGGGK